MGIMFTNVQQFSNKFVLILDEFYDNSTTDMRIQLLVSRTLPCQY